MSTRQDKILIVDDERLMRVSLENQLKKGEYHVKSTKTPIEGLKYIEEEDFDVVIADLKLPEMNGIQFLKEIKKQSQGTVVIIMTAYGTLESAVTAIKEGAYDFIAKPFSTDELIIKIQRALKYKDTTAEVLRLRREIQGRYGYDKIIGGSELMQKVLETVGTISDRDTTILIQGESGTGKELVAGAIHYNSSRRERPFIKLSCAALNREVLESELFGHEKGAFTGAVKMRKGRFELASSGSIFLDDVDDIPLDMQVKLLRVLQEREFERVGGEETISVNVRVICATKKDLKQLVEEQSFRQDLYYRLNVITIDIPPLRTRKEDVPLLVNYFLKKHVLHHASLIPDISQEALDVLISYDWPGNVRELQNAIEHALAFSTPNGITLESLPRYLKKHEVFANVFTPDLSNATRINLEETINEVETRLIQWAYEKSNGNQVRMAEMLGIPRTTLRNKMSRLKMPT
ncbi:MAG: sigma-54-dependent transcriptional regulator [Candidatus Brocadiales bacterium]